MVVTDHAVVTFELERFTADGERLEVTGRWLGVRGRRFMRPTLSAAVGGGVVRSLADLEHKPWAPEDGESWIAAFTWSAELEGITVFELAVTPDLAVNLPSPSTGQAGTAGGAGHEDVALAASRPDDGGPPRSVERPPADVGDLKSDRSRGRAAAELTAALDARNEALGQLDAVAESGRQAQARVSEVESELQNVAQEWAAAVAERDAAVAERADAASVCNRAESERDHAVAEYRRMLADREKLVSTATELTREREQAVSEAKRAAHDRDWALSEAQRMVAERDRAITARDEAVAESEAMRAEIGRLRAERSRTALRPLSDAPARPIQRFGAGERWRSRAASVSVATRVAAFTALVIFIVILLVIISST